MELTRDNLTKEELEALNISREVAGFPRVNEVKNDSNSTVIEDTKDEVVDVDVLDEAELGVVKTTEDEVRELNLKEKTRLRNLGIRPGQAFFYHLTDWNNQIKKLVITYPQTSKAIKYQKFEMTVEGRLVMSMGDMVERFVEDKLIKNFNMEDYPATELLDLGLFLTEVIRNPRFK